MCEKLRSAGEKERGEIIIIDWRLCGGRSGSIIQVTCGDLEIGILYYIKRNMELNKRE